jgi:hypothetical protein
MKQAQEIMKYARKLLNDEQKTGYTDLLMLDCLNAAIRFMWRHIAKIRPQVIAETVSGTLGGSVICLTRLPANPNSKPVPRAMLSIADVRVNGRRLQHIDMLDVALTDARGIPEKYCRIGFDKIYVYPEANDLVRYSVIAVFDAPNLALDDRTPFPDVFDDFIVQYIVIRLSYKNEFNMSQEEGLMATIISQIEQLLYSFETPRPFVDGYFDRREDY